nr:hypothetical protein [uncultured Desulfobacter sp.]
MVRIKSDEIATDQSIFKLAEKPIAKRKKGQKLRPKNFIGQACKVVYTQVNLHRNEVNTIPYQTAYFKGNKK